MKKKLKTLLWSSRPVSWINTAFPFAAGYLLAHGTDVPVLFWVATFYFLIPYNMLIYVINDIYDYESDMQNPRKGGVEGAVLPKELHRFMFWAVIVCNVPFVLYLLVAGSGFSWLVLALSIFDAAAYSVPKLRFKERPVIDSVSSSFHFVSPLLFALSLTGWPAGWWPYVAAFFLWGMASHAFGAVQDIIPDRKAGLHSIATALGASATVRISFVQYILAVVLIAWQGWPSLIVAVAGLLYPLIVSPYLSISDKHSARTNGGWRHFMKINQLVGFCITIIIILQLM
jgi:4-hydroxybenzoate polyprenyltransferase